MFTLQKLNICMHHVTAIMQLSGLMLHIMFHLDNSAAWYSPSIYHDLIIGLETEGAVRITALILLLYLFLPPYVILLSLCYHAVFVFHPLGVPHLVSETLLMYQKTLADHTLCTSRRR